ncbi:hypothetical protein, partial [Clostridioides difficile]|uniref:hypothetical protein n=1 Tax=Clostridioides difficile TaxID=1496 RepID=UPI002108E249
AERRLMPICAGSSRCDDVVFSLLRINCGMSMERFAGKIADQPEPIGGRLSLVMLATPTLPLMFCLDAHRLQEIA